MYALYEYDQYRFEGTAAEVAEWLGITENRVIGRCSPSSVKNRKGKYKKRWEIVRLEF